MKLITTLFALLLLTFTCVGTAYADTFGSGSNAFDIDFVTVGNPGNADDTMGDPSPAGKVATAYRIGQFEVSEQMVDKANTLGGLGITKDTRGADKPATSVSWNEAARFINWLNTSTNSTPAYKFSLQPGDVGYSKDENILLWGPGDAGYNPTNLYRNSLAKYFLPSVDEWYKAAYHDATAGTAGIYFDYPTASDMAPTSVESGSDPNTAVYRGTVSPSGAADVTLAGGMGPYGTVGQGGNVLELVETDIDLVNDSVSSKRIVRGGSWALIDLDMQSSVRNSSNNTAGANIATGFRVASIPEPSSLLLAASGLVGVFLVSSRRTRQGVTA